MIMQALLFISVVLLDTQSRLSTVPIGGRSAFAPPGTFRHTAAQRPLLFRQYLTSFLHAFFIRFFGIGCGCDRRAISLSGSKTRVVIVTVVRCSTLLRRAVNEERQGFGRSGAKR